MTEAIVDLINELKSDCSHYGDIERALIECIEARDQATSEVSRADLQAVIDEYETKRASLSMIISIRTQNLIQILIIWCLSLNNMIQMILNEESQ